MVLAEASHRLEEAELQRRILRFRGSSERLDLTGRVAVIVDDGIATGSTALAACRVVRALGATEVVLAVPVAPPDWTDRFGSAADEYICLETPRGFFAVGQWYANFTQTTDDEVIRHEECQRILVRTSGTGLPALGQRLTPARRRRSSEVRHLTFPAFTI